ncbi:MAG: hypothetical protein LBP79_01135 [Clostridiales bacterium]|jgi:DNA-directed RNA polymerase subunit RPC12/RpoP|nr:hypothetical protein [Clostridiales bacterium]
MIDDTQNAAEGLANDGEQTARRSSEGGGDTVSYNCRSCGGALEYSPKKSALVCPYCGNSETVEMKNVSERDFLSHASASESWANEAFLYACPNCGSTEVIDKDNLTHICPFCGTPAVLKSDALPGVKPDSLLPFTLSGADAESAFKRWTKSRPFLPSALKKNVKADKFRGVFLPAWTFDDNAFSTYEGKLGKTYTVTVGSGKNQRVETRVRYFHVSGSLSEFFDDVCVNASDKIEEKYFKKIQPYDTNGGAAYDKKFLVGFSAVRYGKDINAAWEEAKGKIDAAVRAKILSKYDYDRISYLNVNTTHSGTTFKYILLPLWISAFHYGGRTFNFFVNGTNGNTAGKRPYSAPKILAAVGIGIAVIAAVAVLITQI